MDKSNYQDEWMMCAFVKQKVLIRITRIGKPDRKGLYPFTLVCKGADGKTKWQRCTNKLQQDCLIVTVRKGVMDVVNERLEERKKRSEFITRSLLTWVMFKKQMEERNDAR